MPSYYNMPDLLVLPSFTEGLPDVILEAFACGKPLIASKVGEIPWIVSKEIGWLIERGDAQQFRETLQKALPDRRRVKRMGRVAREYVVENFRWDCYPKEMIKILSECVH